MSATSRILRLALTILVLLTIGSLSGCAAFPGVFAKNAALPDKAAPNYPTFSKVELAVIRDRVQKDPELWPIFHKLQIKVAMCVAYSHEQRAVIRSTHK